MLVPFDLVQGKNAAAAFREFLESTAQCNAINHATEIRIIFPEIAMQRRRLGVNRFVQRHCGRRFAPTQLHQHSIHRDAIEPGREGGVTTKRSNRAEYLKKGFLSEVLSFSNVLRHEETNGINAVLVLL